MNETKYYDCGSEGLYEVETFGVLVTSIFGQIMLIPEEGKEMALEES